jgi:hypothetical protein
MWGFTENLVETRPLEPPKWYALGPAANTIGDSRPRAVLMRARIPTKKAPVRTQGLHSGSVVYMRDERLNR